MIERRAPFVIDEAKFSTQKIVTYALLGLFVLAAADVAFVGDKAERSSMLQSIINFTAMAVGFWIGASKTAADKDAAMSRIAEANTPASEPIKTDEVNVTAKTATVNTSPQPKGKP